MARKILVPVFLALLLVFAASCGGGAKRAIDVAQTAIDQAKEAGAPQYAAEEYKSAEDYLSKAKQQFDERDFRPAKTNAVAAKDQADLAKKRALDRKAAAVGGEKEGIAEGRQPEDLTTDYNVSSLSEQPAAIEDQARAALKDVHFDFDSSEITEENRQILANDVEWLEQNSKVKVTIEGHCDERGSIDYNLALGERRAKAVRDYLVSLGIDHRRLSIISYGESMPLDPGHNEDAWAKNRRAHFAISK